MSDKTDNTVTPINGGLGDGNEPVVSPRSLTSLDREVIAYWVQMAAQLGYPRSVGEIFGYIFVSEQPINADDLVTQLAISRSGAGQGIKTLLEIGAIRPVHNIADRREHFQMQSDLGVLVKQFLNVRVFPPLEELRRQREALNTAVTDSGNPHLLQRFDKLQRWQNKSSPLLAVLKTLAG